MSKQKDQVINANDLAEYLATQDDFDLELYVYRTARELGLFTTHGGTYEDPITKKHRQFDIRAVKTIDKFRIALAIECKSLKTSYPLLVSRIPRTYQESFNDIIESHEATSSNFGMKNFFDCSTIHRFNGSSSIYRPDEFVGKSTSQVGRNDKGGLISGDAQVFEKWSQALSSASDLVSEAHSARVNANTTNFFTLVLPILVISDETLWVADYSGAGSLIKPPEKIEETSLFVDRLYSENLSPNCTLSHLHILTRSKLKSFLGKIAEPGPFWEHAFASLS